MLMTKIHINVIRYGFLYDDIRKALIVEIIKVFNVAYLTRKGYVATDEDTVNNLFITDNFSRQEYRRVVKQRFIHLKVVSLCNQLKINKRHNVNTVSCLCDIYYITSVLGKIQFILTVGSNQE
jgi:hypothetical protein